VRRYTDTIRAGLAWRFKVTLDGLDLPLLFSGCSGLDADYEPLEWKEGGNNATTLRLPGRLSYSNVRLTRTVDRDSQDLRDWFTSHALNPVRGDARVELCDGNGEMVAVWVLSAALPVKYIGPTLTATGGESGESVASESLELSHQGFGR
jgi:phage tail-like protein